MSCLCAAGLPKRATPTAIWLLLKRKRLMCCGMLRETEKHVGWFILLQRSRQQMQKLSSSWRILHACFQAFRSRSPTANAPRTSVRVRSRSFGQLGLRAPTANQRGLPRLRVQMQLLLAQSHSKALHARHRTEPFRRLQVPKPFPQLPNPALALALLWFGGGGGRI